MTRYSFSNFLSDVLEEINKRLCKKGDEYSLAVDEQFHNFIEGAKRRDITKEDYLLNLVCKHEVSVSDMVKAGDWNYDKAHEKIHDILAYYILLLAMFNEHKEELPF